MESSATELIGRGLGDYRLVALAWAVGGDDLFITVSPPGPGTDQVCFRFARATDLYVEMDFGFYSGAPLLYGSEIGRMEGSDGWQVVFDFGGVPRGEIRLVFSEVTVVSTRRGDLAT